VPRKKKISEEALLAVARAVFVEQGFAASTKEIARRAGISESLIFQRYLTKPEFFFAAMAPPVVELEQDLRRVYAPAEFYPAFARLGMAILGYFRVALPVMEPLTSHPEFRFEDFARRHPHSSLAAMRSQVVEFFAANRCADPSAAALLLIGTMRSVAAFEREGAHGGAFPPQIIQRALRCLWQGVRAAPEIP
jgi:AcrR family transcriptional regulator